MLHSEKDTKWTQLVNIIKKKFDIHLYPGAQLDFVSHVGLWAICLWYFICHPNTKEVNIIFLLGTQKLRNYIWRFSCNLSLTEKWFHWNMTTSGSGDYPCYPKRFFKGDNESIPKYDPLLSARLDIAVPLRNAVLLLILFRTGLRVVSMFWGDWVQVKYQVLMVTWIFCAWFLTYLHLKKCYQNFCRTKKSFVPNCLAQTCFE